MLYKKLEGENLYLAPIDANHVELLTKWVNDETLSRGLGGTSFVYTELGEKEYLENRAKKLDNYQFYVVRKADDEIIGIYDLHDVLKVHRYAEVGGFIGEQSERGKGYGTEALKLVCDFGFNVLNLNTLVGRIFVFNHGSIRSAEKVGFKKVGEIAERYFYRGEYYNEIIMQINREEFYKNNKTFVKDLPNKRS